MVYNSCIILLTPTQIIIVHKPQYITTQYNNTSSLFVPLVTRDSVSLFPGKSHRVLVFKWGHKPTPVFHSLTVSLPGCLCASCHSQLWHKNLIAARVLLFSYGGRLWHRHSEQECPLALMFSLGLVNGALSVDWSP